VALEDLMLQPIANPTPKVKGSESTYNKPLASKGILENSEI